MQETLARAQQCAWANLNRIAAGLGATSVSVVMDVAGESTLTAPGLVHRWDGVAIVFRCSGSGPAQGWLTDELSATLDLIAASLRAVRHAEKLQAELKTANARLATRKIVERAKGLLQARRGITEDSAYAYLRGQSRSRRITLARVAEEIVRTHSNFL